MASSLPDEYGFYFQDKAIFLTGATGNLGSCILYRLITQLKPKRVFAFVRDSRTQAIEKLRNKMLGYADVLSQSDSIHYAVGDLRLPGLGVDRTARQVLEDEVNIIIHTAANLSLLDPVADCMKNHCDPTLELARMATRFKKLQRFVYVSSAYANSFLPDGLVEEKVYPLLDSSGEDIDPEFEREEIDQTDSSSFTKPFAWPYALSKYLAERISLTRYSSLPLLIVRPSTIGPALQTPFPLFGTVESCPMQYAAKIYLRDPQASRVWHAPAGASSGTNVLDEIPVDYVSNALLLHVAAESYGIVHATARNYAQLTVNDTLMHLMHAGGSGASEDIDIEWISPKTGPQCALANLFVVGNRDWDFSCARSEALMQDANLAGSSCYQGAGVCFQSTTFARSKRRGEG
ncbi:Putative fatty acyl-CoA reductase [Fulvia fulva]|uniref:Fatty acyl-CoA reductase n=1 Tax=Passalora fulva TaxID=5499 RepID=A0A9Q8L615_PASFU|nr:Putative fatty acyl-CoA reductase [Fulvia fulva]KAK4635467.1 putative fatty acyl-CoA reductase [Fulvia fulva]KAK4638407.1 putative fatty acyl-CoA reductase [Fulvia fulva]UJO11478.1 Putative fatty acyl-CoA reductase [Fulvia fulva]WPV09431.1 Putative fatty acyl-CoA reductase [Fulvia fulva]WPV24490.1 Putative fatty acyl-CoA reductase [Fulvia fulva]